MGSKQVTVWLIRCWLFSTHYGEYQGKKYCQKFLRNVLFGSLVNYAILYFKSYQKQDRPVFLGSAGHMIGFVLLSGYSI